MSEIADNDFNLNISRYVDTSEDVPDVDLDAVREQISGIDKDMRKASAELEKAFRELGIDFPF